MDHILVASEAEKTLMIYRVSMFHYRTAFKQSILIVWFTYCKEKFYTYNQQK